MFDIYINIVCNTFIASLNTKAAMTKPKANKTLVQEFMVMSPEEFRAYKKGLADQQKSIVHFLDTVDRILCHLLTLQELLEVEHLSGYASDRTIQRLFNFELALNNIVHFLKTRKPEEPV